MTEALKQLLKDKPELISEVETYETTATSNAEKIQSLERAKEEAINDRKALRDLIKETTGLSELSKEALSKLGSGDDALKGEVTQLQEKLEAVIGERDGLTSKHQKEINTMRMHDMLRAMGVDKSVWNDKAFEAVADLMLDGASYEDGGFVYKGEDGATIFGQGGKPLTVQEKITQLREDESVYQFKPVQGASGGVEAPPSGKQQTEIGKAVSNVLNNL